MLIASKKAGLFAFFDSSTQHGQTTGYARQPVSHAHKVTFPLLPPFLTVLERSAV